MNVTKFDREIKILLEKFKERPQARYDGTNLKDFRGLSSGQSTKHRPYALYKRKISRGIDVRKPAGLLNKSTKSKHRIAIHRGFGAILKKDADGQRTPKKIGKRLNSKTNFKVQKILPNGDLVILRDTLKKFPENKPRKFKKLKLA